MRRFGVLCAVAVVALAATPATAESVVRPCANPTARCAEWIDLGHGAQGMVYRTYPLGVRNPYIRRALVMVHGALRNADHYFDTATGAAFLAGALGDTIVIAPRFASHDGECQDRLASREANWNCGADSWKSGGQAVGDADLASFDFMDAILRRLADKRAFPNLKVIVVAGHSAGGQFVTRYEMANKIHDRLGVSVRYVVANPSSYAWPDALRPLPQGDGAPDAAHEAWKSESPHTDFAFGPFGAAQAPDFDKWPRGLEDRKSGYGARLTDAELKTQLASRPTTYLLGQVDVLPLGGFDDSPEAMAQGPTRRARGEAFVKHIEDSLGAKPRLMIVPECGHNDRCMFTTDIVLPVLFPPLSPSGTAGSVRSTRSTRR